MPCPPRLVALAVPIFAQAEGPSTAIEYAVAAIATALVLLVVCWPAKRGE
jgi:hypothetical protein